MRINCSIPFGMPGKTFGKHSIVEMTQRLYEIHFSKNAGHELCVVGNRVSIRGIVVLSRLIDVQTANFFSTAKQTAKSVRSR
jgi:hypothetical protein